MTKGKDGFAMIKGKDGYVGVRKGTGLPLAVTGFFYFGVGG